MKMNLLLKLHERQVAIIELMVRANTQKEMFEADYKKFKAQNNIWFYDNFLASTKQRAATYEAIVIRLTVAYIEVQKRINAMQPSLPLTEAQSSHILQLTGNIS